MYLTTAQSIAPGRGTLIGSTMPPSDSYKFAGQKPQLYRNIEDHVSEILAACVRLGYNYYLYGGMVMRLEVDRYLPGSTGFFISFTEMNDARQLIHEASSNAFVVSAAVHGEDALKLLIEAMEDNLNVKPPTFR